MTGEAARLASLPMYDFPELAAETDALWDAIAAALRARGVAAPDRRDRPGGDLAAHWTHPALLVSQSCGWPLTTTLQGRVRVLATPVYDAEGCAGPTYRSALLARVGDPARGLPDMRGRRAAINGTDSLSGCHALRAAAAPLAREGRFFGAVIETGAHRLSARAVAAGEADLCAVDCVSWRLIRRVEPGLAAALRVIGWTDPAPALPFVTAAAAPEALAAALTAALAEAFAGPAAASARAALGIAGAVPASAQDYAAVRAMGAAADAAGFPALA
jgi:ABC-type phosphate/phosphonate transport system substrate-binding protein